MTNDFIPTMKRRRNDELDRAYLAGLAGDLSLTNRISFPMKLYQVLEDVAGTANSSIVGWSDDGKAFQVYNTDAFVANIMPRYFRQTRYKSFQRQLHLYGFTRIGVGKNKGCYQHEKFQKENRELCQSMVPVKKKPTDRKPKQSPKSTSFGEPNSMPVHFTLPESSAMFDGSHIQPSQLLPNKDIPATLMASAALIGASSTSQEGRRAIVAAQTQQSATNPFLEGPSPSNAKPLLDSGSPGLTLLNWSNPSGTVVVGQGSQPLWQQQQTSTQLQQGGNIMALPQLQSLNVQRQVLPNQRVPSLAPNVNITSNAVQTSTTAVLGSPVDGQTLQQPIVLNSDNIAIMRRQQQPTHPSDEMSFGRSDNSGSLQSPTAMNETVSNTSPLATMVGSPQPTTQAISQQEPRQSLPPNLLPSLPFAQPQLVTRAPNLSHQSQPVSQNNLLVEEGSNTIAGISKHIAPTAAGRIPPPFPTTNATITDDMGSDPFDPSLYEPRPFANGSP